MGFYSSAGPTVEMQHDFGLAPHCPGTHWPDSGKAASGSPGTGLKTSDL